MTAEAVIKKTKKLPVGVSDFKRIIEGDYHYVDKSLFIKEVIDKGDTILLIPRPRRFGKTLNLSMLKYFYDCIPDNRLPGSEPPTNETDTSIQGNKKLFDSLAIREAGDQYLEKMGRHPVIFLSFRTIKELDWETCISKIKRLIQKEYARHGYLLESKKILPFEQDYFKKIVALKGDRGDYEDSLENLLRFLSRYYGKRAVILIDEYDAPVHAGFNHGYYDKIINFMRNFLGGGLKDTDQHLEKSVLTGILRVAKESIFSGLNNPGVYTLLSVAFNDKFGFTEKEVETLLEEFDCLNMYDRIREWYNGYRFGEKTIYNPWSIINFLGDKAKKFKPYWINTSDNEIVETLLSSGGKELKEELELLIQGETVEKIIDENIILRNVDSEEDSLWSFLLMGGYLKTTSERMVETTGKTYYNLAIPNLEVKSSYSRIINRYFTTKIENKTLTIMLDALIKGDVKLFERMLKKVVIAVFSYHDFGDEPEKVYHALVAGLLTWISDTHEIKSNRESGYGRYDIMVIPKDTSLPGYVIEFKTVDKEENETVELALAAALAQMEEKKYETELVERGVKTIKRLAIAFNGKHVHLKVGPESGADVFE